jgi:serine-type D-Ala-D-Ala carboxypeptidase (penicillin-binding protein 5/6)
LLAPKPEAANNTAASAASGPLPDIDTMPVRVGVGIVGAIVVFGLIMAARSLNRRTAQ